MIVSIMIIALSSIAMLFFSKHLFKEMKVAKNIIAKISYAVFAILVAIAAIMLSVHFIPLEIN